MANPIKIVSRVVGGITGKGGKNVNPVYNEPIKINSNPNKTPARGERNPTQTKLDNQDRADALENKYPPVKSNTIKINSNRRGR